MYNIIVPVTKSIDLYGDKLRCDSNQKAIWDNSKLGNDSENVKPGTNILSSLCDWSTEHSGELVGIQPNLNPVIKESKQWSKRKGNNKDGDEAILNDCRGEIEEGKERERDLK